MLSNQSKYIDFQNLKRLAAAMLLSVLLHLLFLDKFNWRLIDANALAHEDIQVVLVSPPAKPVILAPPPQPELIKPVHDTPPKTNSKPISKPKQSSEAEAVPQVAGLPVPSENPLIQMAPQSGIDLTNSGEVGSEASGTDNSTTIAEPPKDPLPKDDSPAGLTAEQLNQLPTQVDMIFDVLFNGKIGETVVHFRRSTDGHYRLTSERHATGLAAMIVKSKDLETSEGLVSSVGLNPTSYTRQYGKEGNKLHHATLDWASAKLTLQENSTNSVIDLPAGTQDMLSFMYQFMFVPPLTEMQVSITNGRKLNQYTYRFEGEETLDTPLGKMKVLHIAKNGDEAEGKLDLWLGIDYHYLPMKIRKIDKDDKVYEQVISKLDAK